MRPYVSPDRRENGTLKINTNVNQISINHGPSLFYTTSKSDNCSGSRSMKTTVRQLLVHGLVRPRLMRTAQRDSTLAGEQAVDVWTMRFAQRGACRGQLRRVAHRAPLRPQAPQPPTIFIPIPRIEDTNKEKSRVRVRVEHVFGAQAQMGGHIVRTIGLLRARVKIGMMNLVYNMVRLGQLLRRDGRGAPAMA